MIDVPPRIEDRNPTPVRSCDQMSVLPAAPRRPIVLALSAFLFLLAGCDDGNPASSVVEETITLALSVHLLHSAESDALTSTLSDSEVEFLLQRLNGTWSQAGIEWRLDAIHREAALNAGLFERALNGLAPPTFDDLVGVLPQGQSLGRRMGRLLHPRSLRRRHRHLLSRRSGRTPGRARSRWRAWAGWWAPADSGS